MYARYKLCCRIINKVVYERYFLSINQAVKVATGFDFEDADCYISIFDDLTQQVFSNAMVKRLVKEFINVEILS